MTDRSTARPQGSADPAARTAEILNPSLERLSARDVAVVVAHPDDETIGCGAQLRRWRDATVIMMTDGAPRNLADAHALGFDSALAYGNARHRELLEALSLVDVAESSLIELGISDQEVARNLGDATIRLSQLFQERGIRIVLTHAYEGGHPDHDATAFAVHAAAALMARGPRGSPISVIEMPYYHADAEDAVRQIFIPRDDAPVLTIALNDRDRELKRRMMAAHKTQAAVLAQFEVAAERFRLAPVPAFQDLPNGGNLLYERYDWGMTGREWRTLVRHAAQELEFDLTGSRPQAPPTSQQKRKR